MCGLLVFMVCTKVAFAFAELWGLLQVCERVWFVRLKRAYSNVSVCVFVCQSVSE